MKKMIAVLLTLICVAAFAVTCASADGGTWICPNCGDEVPDEYNFCPADATPRTTSNGSWPVWTLNGVNTRLKSSDDESKRYQSFFGPNRKNYHGAGAYKPYKVTSATALFSEGGYVLVDLSYRTVGRRIVYFQAGALTNTSVREETLTGHAARTSSSVQPYYGPGGVYDAVTDSNRAVILDANTSVSVFFETNGWVFAEFNCELGLIRAWLPVDSVY